jgi:hypothetical protein
MNERELFNAIMHYEPFERVPVWYNGEWPETTLEWAEQGLPPELSRPRYFDTVTFPWTVPTDLPLEFLGSRDVGRKNEVGLRWPTMLLPAFPEEVFEETEEYRVFRQFDGVIVKQWKHQSSIPHSIDYTFRSARDWPDYKRRLQPDPRRLPKDLDKILEQMHDYDEPVRMRVGSLMGVIRNWMGVERFCVVQMEDQELLSEIVDTIANLACWEMDHVLPKLKIDLAWAWEDISSRSGPFISPRVFKKCVVPGYQKISAKLRQYGVDLFGVDCDGILDPLIPGFLEGGVNILYPIEVGTWKADVIQLRRRFGRELRLIGGVNKLELLKGREAIDAELARRLPLVQEGGYVPTPDHEIVPGTKLEDYKYYLERIRAFRVKGPVSPS